MKRWSKLSKTLFVIGSAAAVVTAAALSIRSKPTDQLEPATSWVVPEITKTDVDRAFASGSNWTTRSTTPAHVGITPHHALVAPIIAGWLMGLHDQPSPATVVIIGPDHQNRGTGYLTTAKVDWRTPDGVARVNRALVEQLTADGAVVIDEQLIQHEHGVYTAIPFIHRAWPSAKVVTIAVKGDARPDRLQRLAQLLDEQLGADDIVLATVDFSHYTTAIDALQADQASIEVLQRGDAIAALDLSVDSPPAISFILMLANRRGLNYKKIAHTTSAQFTGQVDAQSTTSYLSAYFTDEP